MFESMMERGMQDLSNQDVLVMRFVILHADVNEDLMDMDLKLKLRMDGVTHLKTAAQRSKPSGRGTSSHARSRLNFDTIASTIYEGGNELHFDLCKPSRLFGASHILASCQLSLTEALESLEIGGSVKEVSNLELLAADGSGKVLATLAFAISIKSTALKAVGGTAALKTTVVPGEPSHIFDDYASHCKSFILQSSVSRLRLQSALNSARAAIDTSRSQAKEAACDTYDSSTSCESCCSRPQRLDSSLSRL
jgi:hypothetical protein